MLVWLLWACAGPEIEPDLRCARAMDGAPAPTDLGVLEDLLDRARTVVPELDGVSITLTEGESETDFFYSNLVFSTLVDPPLEREYLAYYNPRMFDDPPPGDAAVGILVHELAHVLDYTEMDGQTLAEFGIWYATEDVADYEHQTDRFAMERGCTLGLIGYGEWTYGKVEGEDLDEKRRVYWTPDAMLGWMTGN